MKKLLKMILADKLLLSLSVVLLLITGVSASLIVVKASETLFRSSPTVEAIDLTSLTEDEITEWYEKAFGTTNGLVFKEAYDEEIEPKKVISQDPKAGEGVSLDTGMTITLSQGKDPNKTFDLPDFVEEGYTKEEIEKYFDENGFTNVTYEYKVSTDEEVKKDTVLAVNRSGMTKRSEAILVTLSAGDETDLVEVKVPDLLEMTEAEAKAWASSYSINLSIERVFSNNHASGKIISQSISEGETIKGGDTITIRISRGKGITIADLKNKTLEQAKSYASENGFKLETRYDYSDSVEKGLIAASSPSAGGMLAKGDTLIITISEGKDPASEKVNVESYAGKSEDDLLAYVKKLGMEASKESAKYSDSVSEGLVAYNTTGEVAKSTTIQYGLSLGRYTIDKNDFEGETLANAQKIVKAANDLGANITFNFEETTTNSYEAGTLYGCSVTSSGKAINCRLAKAGSSGGGGSSSLDDTVYINSKNYYTPVNPTVDKTLALIKNSFGAFKNLEIIKEESSMSAGAIIEITVNGSASYKPGYYNVDTTDVVIRISIGKD